ncbi:MAG: hypothetical protein Q4D61_02030, partial [Cardiobacteriaceae bacterium]|nr:hypothetical protein [Cardiobacteriaceae bacterium]
SVVTQHPQQTNIPPIGGIFALVTVEAFTDNNCVFFMKNLFFVIFYHIKRFVMRNYDGFLIEYAS